MGFYIGQTKIFGISILSQNTQSSYEIKRQLGNGVTESTSNILTIKEGGSVDLKFTVSSGYVFDNATATNCQYSWKPSTGTLTISNPTSTVNVSVSSLQRLMKPTNLSISDGTLTFDEVVNVIVASIIFTVELNQELNNDDEKLHTKSDDALVVNVFDLDSYDMEI